MPHADNLTRAIAHHRSRTVTVIEQSIHLDLSQQLMGVSTFRSFSTMRVICTETEVQIDLVADEAPTVILDGQEIDAPYADSLVTVRGLTPGREHLITVNAVCTYSHTGEGLHRFHDPQDDEVYLYTHFEPTDARRVFACFDQPDLKTRFRLSVLAPTGRVVRSNTEIVRVEAAGDPDAETGEVPFAVTHFAPTQPQSTYILCVVVGPYHVVDDVATMPDGRTIPLSIMCRPAMKDALPAEDVLRWTKAGLPWCESRFGVGYPWVKYDQIFVPEYNIGAMENPGLVTFNENALTRGDATRSEREALATTVLHEMAHMWFGDLVTMPWWDDLWLKESFADFIGTQAAAEVTEFTDAWATFTLERKAWAYQADQLPTTHPIVADIPDVEAARANFDGITYAKGASVLRQLVAYVGEETFYRGAALYFERHAFTNATLDDFLDALSEASGRDMSAWAQAWLMTSGPDTLSFSSSGAQRVIVRDGERPHRVHVAGFDLDADGWHPCGDAWLDVAAARTRVPDEVGGALVIVDDDAWTYAKIAPDAALLEAFMDRLADLESATQRATAWSQLWQACRDARLPAPRYLRAVMTHLPRETSSTIVDGVTRTAHTAVTTYLPAASRPRWADELWAGAIERTQRATNDDLRGVWRRAALRFAGVAPAAVPSARAMVTGETTVGTTAPFEPDQDERWALLTALAAHADAGNRADVERLLAVERERDTSKRAAARHLCATALFADDAAKRSAWRRTADTTLTNEQVAALVTGLTHPATVIAAHVFADDYLESLEHWWATRSQVIASRLARGLFAVQVDPHGARGWLETHPGAPGALRRIVVEEIDHLERSLRAQHVKSGSAPA